MAFCTSCGARLAVPDGVDRSGTGAYAGADVSLGASQPDAPSEASGYGASQPYQQPYQQQYPPQYPQPYDPLSQAPYQQFAPAYAAAPTSDRKKRTALIVSVSAVAALVAVAVVGFLTGWFGLSGSGTGAPSALTTATSGACNVQCHNPMDYYVEDFADDGSTSLASLHRKASSLAATSATPKDVGCTDCHTRSVAIDATEQSDWASGNYSTDADGKLTLSAFEVMKIEGTTAKAFCTRCHDYDKVTASTENWGGEAGVNPHYSHQGELECTNCHSVHDTSMLYCNSCHTFKLPTGWEAPAK